MTNTSYQGVAIGPRFTIGIPVYNGEHTLKETLDCCAKLPTDLVRVVISDNGSTDGTYTMVQSFAARHHNVSVYRQEWNVGAANNFKYLLDICNTEYFMWLAADDVIADSLSLAEVERLFEEYPKAIALSPFAMVGEVGAPVPDRGNCSLVGSRACNTLNFLMRPGVNSRFYSIYRTEHLRPIFSSVIGDGNGNYFGSDIVFSSAVLRKYEWPMAPSFVLLRKPGISSDGWKLRRALSKNLLGALFPSVNFIHQIVGMSPLLEKLPVLLVGSLLYLRYLIGPIRHRLSQYLRRL